MNKQKQNERDLGMTGLGMIFGAIWGFILERWIYVFIMGIIMVVLAIVVEISNKKK